GVPGSTSNVGAGCDCVGIAIERRLSATFRVDRALGAPVRVERRGTLQAVTVPSDRDWLFAGFVAACRGAGCKVPGGVMIDAASEIPIGRGLGSSGAATVAGALAARALLGLELDDAALARLCAHLEHHPDNVARLAAALDDVLHAPHRRSLVRGYDAVTAAARAAGAFGATLSGSGSSILAVTPAFAAKAVATTMARVWGALDVTAETFVIER